jgi:hypothetical protein
VEFSGHVSDVDIDKEVVMGDIKNCIDAHL